MSNLLAGMKGVFYRISLISEAPLQFTVSGFLQTCKLVFWFLLISHCSNKMWAFKSSNCYNFPYPYRSIFSPTLVLGSEMSFHWSKRRNQSFNTNICWVQFLLQCCGSSLHGLSRIVTIAISYLCTGHLICNQLFSNSMSSYISMPFRRPHTMM